MTRTITIRMEIELYDFIAATAEDEHRTVNGHRVYNKWFYDQFAAAVKKAKLPHITPHSLRHTLNSALLLKGVSPYLIQKYLGWSNTSSLTRVQEGYTHVKATDLQVVADGIDGLYVVKKAAPG